MDSWIAGDEIRCARLAHGMDRLTVDDGDDMRRTVAAYESRRRWGVPRAACHTMSHDAALRSDMTSAVRFRPR